MGFPPGLYVYASRRWTWATRPSAARRFSVASSANPAFFVDAWLVILGGVLGLVGSFRLTLLRGAPFHLRRAAFQRLQPPDQPHVRSRVSGRSPENRSCSSGKGELDSLIHKFQERDHSLSSG